MRVIKDYRERKKELLDTAEKLFITNGYNKTTIDGIREEVGIAKGTFYHYFHSKEKILDAIIERIIKEDADKARKVMQDEKISCTEKLFQILLSQYPQEGNSKDRLTQNIHKPENAVIYIKTIVSTIQELAPVMAEVIKEGNKRGEFNADYPQMCIDMLIVSGQILLDESLFGWTEEQISIRREAFVHLMERLLGAEKDSFRFMYQILK